MCKVGDIIVIKEFKNEIGEPVKKHSFVVISDESNSIGGLNYDFISNMLCSFHDNNHRNKKLRYEENLEIKTKLKSKNKTNNKIGFIKADQLYYFDKDKIEYYILGHLSKQLLDELMSLIFSLDKKEKLKIITTNIENETIKN